MRTSAPRRRRTLVVVAAAATVAAVVAAVLVALTTSPSPAPASAPVVVSLTFDDGLASQWAAAGALDARGMAGTFYLNSAFLGANGYLTRSQVQSLAGAGHEIGGHTAHHVDVTTLTAATAPSELCGDRNTLLGLGVGPVTSFAYPFGHVSPAAEQLVRSCGYTNARWAGYLGAAGVERIPPTDPYALRTVDFAGSTTTPASLLQYVTNARARGGGWLIFTFHAICNNQCNGPANSFATASFTSFLDGLVAQRANGTIVVQTVGDVMAGAPAPPPSSPTTTAPPPPPGPPAPPPTVPGPPAPPPTVPGPPPVSPPAPAPQQGAGYWMVTSDGAVHAFGAAGAFGDAQAVVRPREAAGDRVVDLEPTPTAGGYWLADALGAVYAFGDAPDLGGADLSAAQLATGERVTSVSATPSGAGYWLFTNRGRAVPRGDATFLGDLAASALNGPVLDSVATPTGGGYWLVADDGGVFAFGDAPFLGSLGATPLNAPVRALVPSASDRGYWLVATDGGVFAFGDAGYVGSVPGVLGAGQSLNRPISGMVRYGDGYLVVAEDGGIFSFSDLPFLGSLGADPPDRPVVAVAAT